MTTDTKLTQEDLDNLKSIQNCPGLFTGQFPDESIYRLEKHGLIRRSYQGFVGLMGLSYIYPTIES